MSRTVPSTTGSTVVEPVSGDARVALVPSDVAASTLNPARSTSTGKLNRNGLLPGLFALLVAAGCSSSPAGPIAATSETETASVEISPGELATPSGFPARLTATVHDSRGKILSDEVEWSSNDPTVAIVDIDGTVWSFKSGSTSATATFPGKSGSSGGNAYGRAKKDAEIQVIEDTPDRPGQVTDLSVDATSTSSATLTFTEVDDGLGGAADYLVRFQVAPLSWGSAADVAAGTCAAPLNGSGAGTAVSCTVDNLAAETAYQFQVVAIRAADGVHGNLSNVASGTTAGTQSAPEPESPTSGSGSYPNEPAGLSTIASVDFTHGINAQIGACTEHSDTWKRSNTEYIADSSAPTGDGSVFRGKFPSGMRDGISPWRFDCWGPGMNASGGQYDYEELYVTYWLRVEGTDYENQTVGTKTHYIAYGSTGRQNHSAPFLDGTFQDQTVMSRMTYAPYVYEMRDDGSDAGGGAVRRTPNITGHSKKVEVGGWTQIELYYRANDIGPTTDNGILRVWIDGTLTHEETGIRYRSDLNPLGFYHFQFTPVYGGNSGDVRTRNDFWRLDQVYISAR